MGGKNAAKNVSGTFYSLSQRIQQEGVPLVPVEFGDEWCTLNFKTAASARLSRGRWKVLVIAGMIHGTDGLCSISGLF